MVRKMVENAENIAEKHTVLVKKVTEKGFTSEWKRCIIKLILKTHIKPFLGELIARFY